jgi:predicted nucleic acid-binding protein
MSDAHPRHRSFDGVPAGHIDGRPPSEGAARPRHGTLRDDDRYVEEIMRGWMAAIHQLQDPHRQVNAYAKLQQLFRFFATSNVLEWNKTAADEYDSLKRAKVKVGTMDLKIASIAMASDATLLTRNRIDFS